MRFRSCAWWVTLLACGEPSGERDAATDAATDGMTDAGSMDGAIPDGGLPLTPDEERWLIDGPEAPHGIVVEVDEARAVDAVVGEGGGVLSAEAADGTQFELAVPAGALLNDTPIRMAPLRSIGGLPMELSEPHGVQLLPEGLSFLEMVTLKITPASIPPIADVVPFGFHGDGEGLFLTHRGASADEILVLLDHFSGYGAAAGQILESPELVMQTGQRMQDRLRSRMAWERMRAARSMPADPTVFPPLPETDRFFRLYYERVYDMRLALGSTQCDAARDTLALITQLVHDRYLVGVSEDQALAGLTTDLRPLAPYVLNVARICLAEEYEQCVGGTPRIVHRIIPMWRGLRQQARLYGVDEEQPIEFEQLDTVAEDYIDRCLRFRLEFTSDSDYDEPGGGGYRIIVRADVDIRAQPANFDSGSQMLQGEGNLSHDLFVFELDGCSVTSDAGPDALFEVDDMVLHTSPYVFDGEDGTLEGITLHYFPGVTGESYRVTCPMGGTFSSPPMGIWTGGYLSLHMSEFNESRGLFEKADWSLGTDPLAMSSWSPLMDQLQENGMARIRHEPE